MNFIFNKINEYKVLVVVALVAMLLASHQLSDDFGVIGNYLYWLFRILIQTGCFYAVLVAMEKHFSRLLPVWGLVLAAILISLLPFTLAITAFDLIVGLPELGLLASGADESQSSGTYGGAFALELLYLLDNHLAVCLLVYLPRFALSAADSRIDKKNSLVAAGNDSTNNFLDAIEPPLDGELCSIEAQEHYVRIQTTNEARMVLYRFSDAVRQMPQTTGMQVHRSHWVADSAVNRLIVNGQSMKLELNDSSQIPVSRTFRTAAEQRYTKKS